MCDYENDSLVSNYSELTINSGIWQSELIAVSTEYILFF